VVRNENLQGIDPSNVQKYELLHVLARKMISLNGKPAVALSIQTQIKYGSEYYDAITNAEDMVFRNCQNHSVLASQGSRVI
jgi:hypothetical protein